MSTETTSVKTLPDGYYFMELAAGTYTLRADSSGYDPNYKSGISISSNKSTMENLSLNPVNNFIVDGFWTTDKEGNLKTSFAPGDNIKFNIKFTLSTEKSIFVVVKGKAYGEKSTRGKWRIRLSRKSERLSSGSYIWSWDGIIPETVDTEKGGTVTIKISTSKYGSIIQNYDLSFSSE